MNLPIVIAIFVIGCMTIIAFVVIALYLAFTNKQNTSFYQEIKPLKEQFKQHKKRTFYRGKAIRVGGYND